MLDSWLPLGLTVGEIEVVTAGKRCVELLNMLYSKNSSIKLVTNILYKYENILYACCILFELLFVSAKHLSVSLGGNLHMIGM